MAFLQNIDPDGLFEYLCIYRQTLNHMSQNFQLVMRSLSKKLKQFTVRRSSTFQVEVLWNGSDSQAVC